MDGTLNSKYEWRQNQIKRIAVHLTDKELREVEKNLVDGEAEVSRALVDLGNKLKPILCLNPFLNLIFCF